MYDMFNSWLIAIALNLFICRFLVKLVKRFSNTAFDCSRNKAWTESLPS